MPYLFAHSIVGFWLTPKPRHEHRASGGSANWGFNLARQPGPDQHKDQVIRIKLLEAPKAPRPATRIRLTPAGVGDVADIEQSLAAFARERNGALVIIPGPVNIQHRQSIIAAAGQGSPRPSVVYDPKRNQPVEVGT